MSEFIKLIENIGFEKNLFISTPHTLIFEFRNWEIKIIKGIEIRWKISNRYIVNSLDEYSIDNIEPIHKYFKTEIRNFKLKKLGI